MNHTIKTATIEDSETILILIKELAAYEKMEDKVVATVEDIHKTLFCKHPKAEAMILEVDMQPAGFVLFFHNYSTFLGKHDIYIEDLYVRKNYRKLGYGKTLIQKTEPG